MKFMPLLFVSLFAAVSLSAQQATPVSEPKQHPTHHAGNQPLFVVNGVYYNGSDFSDTTALKPEDIQEITVLKDKDAAARFGEIADNGVILITTKTSRPAGISIAAAVEKFYGDKLSNAMLYAVDGRMVKPDGLKVQQDAVRKIEILKKESGLCVNIITHTGDAQPSLPQASPFKPKPGEIWIRGTASNSAPNNRD